VHPVKLPVLGILRPNMLWFFNFHPAFTTIGQFVLNGVPSQSTITVTCRGGGCPYRSHSVHVGKLRHPKSVDVLRAFRNRHLRPGTLIVVTITRPQYVAKYYSFKIRKGKGPLITISCLAPGGTRPGVGC
jgi:hypothetical protein